MSDRYPFAEIEPKWQREWQERKLFRAVDGDARKPKCYVLDMFPYPSGAGLHVGHPEGYTATDIYCRYKRMRGFNVLHPMGWDAFGLPAEQYAIETGTHPRETTRKNIETFKRQIKRLGFSYDWDREIDTTDPAYVKWTQWIFLKLYHSWFNPNTNKAESIETLTYPPSRRTEEEKRAYRDGKRLAHLAHAQVWWCTFCGTVLANEEVVDGKCERKGHPVERRPMRQWMLKITAYAERLLADLDALDWPEHIKAQQRHWIGKSEGAFIDFKVCTPVNVRPEGQDWVVEGKGIIGDAFTVFTTRPDTLFGATYVVISPEHLWVDAFVSHDKKSVVEKYRKACASKSDLERTDLSKGKTGVFIGAYAVNPVNSEKIPIWIADYVLVKYGTGAIMAVPAHDQRDFEFAKQYDLPIRPVIVPEGARLPEPLEQAFEEPGRMHDSGTFTGLRSEEAKGRIVTWLESRKVGEKTVTYKLRDWLFSRQRYWGEPIPIVHCERCGIVPLPESALPLTLPHTEAFGPAIFKPMPEMVIKLKDGENYHHFEAPLNHAGTKDPKTGDIILWRDTTCPKCNGPAHRETNTMPQWAGSCWYYLRYLDPKNDRRAWDPAKERDWMPVDLYIGGAEHAVLHLLYARFWHKVLYDLTLVSTPEPFAKLVNQGLILGEDHEKMSKSRGNVVNPDAVIDAHGADAFRLYEMFLGPLEAVKPWSMRSIEGVDRFLNRVWRLGEQIRRQTAEGRRQSEPPALERKRHETIKRVTEDIEHLRFNTAISAMMEFLNAIYDARGPRPAPHAPRPIREAFETLVLLLAPFAPHMCEELWQRLGHPESLAFAPWPAHEPAALEQDEALLIVQVNGKVRARVTVPADLGPDELKQRILTDEQVKRYVDQRPIKQFIIVPKRLVNLVV